MTDKKTSTELTLPQRAAVALGSAEHEANLKALAAKHADIVEIKNAAGREQAHGAMMTLANARVSITKAGKAARDDANAFSKAVIAEEKRLIEIIEPEETRLRTMRDEWDAEREREKQAKAEAEARRIAIIREHIDDIRAIPGKLVGLPSARIQAEIEDLASLKIGLDRFEEFTGEATTVRDAMLDYLRGMHTAAVEREVEAARLKAEQEAEAARLAAEREELERLRAAEEERQRIAAAERAEEERKARAEYEVEQTRLAAERAAQEATLRVEREAHERQMAAERAEQEAKLRAQREEEERAAREKWMAEQQALQAERDRQAAEAKRLADERAELERQQREADELRQREEAARQAQADAADAQVRGAAYEMLDALRQWRYAEQTGDAEELANARMARDEAIDAATLVDAEFAEA